MAIVWWVRSAHCRHVVNEETRHDPVPARRLAEVDGLDLADWHYWHAARAELLARMGRPVAAVAAADRALALVDNRAEERFLRQRRRHWSGEADRDG